MKQVAPGSLFNEVYFDFWIMNNCQANLPLAPTIERIKCTSMYKHNNKKQQPKTIFLCNCWKSFLSCLLTVVYTSFPWCWLVNVKRFEAVFVDTCYLKVASVDTACLRACFVLRNSVSMRNVAREFLLVSAHLISLLPNVHLHVHLTLRKLV